MNEQKSDSTWWLKVVFVLFWILLLIGGYFWGHQPVSAEVLDGLGTTLANIAVWLLISWTGALLGYRLLAPVLENEAPFARLAIAAGAGLGLISIFMGLLGLLGLLVPLAAWGLVVGLNLVSVGKLRLFWSDLRQLRLPRPTTRMQRWFLIYGLASLGMTFFLALTPPTAWDSLVYHLTGPKLYIEAGRIVHPIDLPYLGFPLLGQMQFTLGMLLFGDGVAALLHFGYGLLALGVTVALARNAIGETAGWFAGVILLSIPSLFSLMSYPYVDVTLLFYATAAFYAFYRWREEHEISQASWGWLVVLGMYCGFAGGVKYTAVAIPLSLGLSIIWTSRHDGLGTIVKRIGLVAVIALGLVTPWLLENWLTTGNPVYPFFIDDALYWDEWRAWWYDRPETGLATTAPWRLLIVPIEATILGTEGSEFYEFTVGPLLLFGGSLLILVWRHLSQKEKAVCGHMLLFFLLNYLLWLNGLARTGLLLRARFLLPVFGIVATLGGLGLARLPALRRSQLDLNWLVLTFFNLALALILFTSFLAFLRQDPLPVVLGITSRARYLEQRLGSYSEVVDKLNQLPETARIYFLWEPRSYGCTVDCWSDALLDRWLHQTQYYELEAGEIVKRWRNEGVTHILLYEDGLQFIKESSFDPIMPHDLQQLQILLENYMTEIWQVDKSYSLYRFNSPQ